MNVITTYIDFIDVIKEGVIITHNITKYSRILTDYLDKLNIKHKINILDKLKFYLELNTNDLTTLECINHQAYTLGYFPSEYKLTLNSGLSNNFKDIDKDIDKDSLHNIKSIEITYEAKYDDGLYKNDIICPPKLYHLTYDDNYQSICDKGLYPKSKNRLSIHPKRIYLFDDINNSNVLLNNLKISDRLKGIYKTYSLLEIDSSNDKFIIHTDPNYRLGYFTYDNISPILIKRINKNL